VQGLQGQTLSGFSAGERPAGGDQNHLLAVRKGNNRSFPSNAGAPRVLPRVFPAAAVHGFAGLTSRHRFALTRADLAAISDEGFAVRLVLENCFSQVKISWIAEKTHSSLAKFGQGKKTTQFHAIEAIRGQNDASVAPNLTKFPGFRKRLFEWLDADHISLVIHVPDRYRIG
jgi:hypothetical protein